MEAGKEELARTLRLVAEAKTHMRRPAPMSARVVALLALAVALALLVRAGLGRLARIRSRSA
jgi:hypothetical protein